MTDACWLFDLGRAAL